MKILETVDQVRSLMDAARGRGESVGVMGTSGRMHEGHLSLVRQAIRENDLAVMFWLGDLRFAWAGGEKVPGLYDRDWAVDRALCASTGIEYVYLPDSDDYMPERPMTVTLVPALSTGCPRMEDPAHLDEVTTATAKLWSIFGPMRYYSGEKDWQQLAMFERMAIDLSCGVEVVACPVARERDGLAMSSRNVKLSAEERARAPGLFAALEAGRGTIEAGERSSAVVEAQIRDALAAIGEVLYVHCVDAETLQPMERLRGAIRLIASVRLGDVPLVDNVGIDV